MESYPRAEDVNDANEALDAIAAAELGTYVPSGKAAQTRLPLTEALLVMAGGAISLAATLWLMTSGVWWRFLLGIAVSAAFVMTVMRVEQRHTNVRPKFIMPRHAFWAALRETWPIALATGLLVPVFLRFGDSEPGFVALVLGAAAFLVCVLVLFLFFQRFRRRSRAATDD